MIPGRYRTYLEIEAIQVGAHPWNRIAEWCGGRVVREAASNRNAFIILDDTPGKRVLRASKGDWICRIPGRTQFNSWTIIPDHLFHTAYERVD